MYICIIWACNIGLYPTELQWLNQQVPKLIELSKFTGKLPPIISGKNLFYLVNNDWARVKKTSWKFAFIITMSYFLD